VVRIWAWWASRSSTMRGTMRGSMRPALDYGHPSAADGQANSAPAEGEAIESAVDVFDEEERSVIVAEMPGIAAEDIRVELRGDTLVVYAERGRKKYRNRVQVQDGLRLASMSISCNNGIVVIRIGRQPA
jgi:HSP20 family molecular chaperone IbpA